MWIQRGKEPIERISERRPLVVELTSHSDVLRPLARKYPRDAGTHRRSGTADRRLVRVPLCNGCEGVAQGLPRAHDQCSAVRVMGSARRKAERDVTEALVRVGLDVLAQSCGR